jgi:LmbE family N-acetylglucosaminyl deacetylase
MGAVDEAPGQNGMSGISQRLGLPTDRAPRCLLIGAHPDDLEIGAGGTILRLIEERPDVRICWVILSGDGARAEEARTSAASLGRGAEVNVELLGGRDAFLPYDDPAGLKERLASLAAPVPDLVLVHRRDDAHQDHRFANDLAWQVCRGATILEYEIPKWDGDSSAANLYVHLTARQAERKINHLLTAFPSQVHRHWYSAETFHAVLRLRGVECRAPDGLAEAFVARKLSV